MNTTNITVLKKSDESLKDSWLRECLGRRDKRAEGRPSFHHRGRTDIADSFY